jgi:hypothetical protein
MLVTIEPAGGANAEVPEGSVEAGSDAVNWYPAGEPLD